MGIYLNPGCEGFRQIRKGIYVDKTGLIDYINSTIETAFKLTVVSRPRRFGKSFAAKMLCAYYDKSCNSRQLFDKMEISKAESFEEHLNQYNVIYLDITRFISRAISTGDSVVLGLQMAVIQELREAYPECIEKGMVYLPDALNCVSRNTGDKFIIIIDEWDALFREAKNSSALLKEYVQLLRGLFKGGTATDDSIAAAYMTGILPIKKYGTQSALTDFQEYTMTNPDFLSVYVGFTEDEVRVLCSQYNMDFEEMKHWYDGYSFYDQRSVYNPNSVISAIRRRNFRSYWTETETYESLKDYITENFDGLKDAIVLMLGGQRESVYTGSFQNDMTSFKSKDDILTLLIHLGYLAYDGTSNEVYIPNQEVADAFQAAVRNTGWDRVSQALIEADQLLKATINGESERVAQALEMTHEACSSSLAYNDENSLSCAVLLAYYTARNYYEVIRELPAGKGFVDIAFIPRKNTDKPPMIIELKYNRSADTAIRQIKENRYDGRMREFYGNLILVGINYDREAKGENAKRHTCVIEKVTQE